MSSTVTKTTTEQGALLVVVAETNIFEPRVSLALLSLLPLDGITPDPRKMDASCLFFFDCRCRFSSGYELLEKLVTQLL